MLEIREVRHDAGTMQWYEEEPEPSDHWSLILMGYGRCIYWIEGEKVLLEKGDNLLVPAGSVFYGKSIPSVSHEKYAVSFTVSGASATAPPLPLLAGTGFKRLRSAKTELLLARAAVMHEQWREKLPYAEVLCGALLLECLTYVNREWDQGPLSSVKHRQAEQMKSFLKNRYRGKVTKEDLAAVIGKSPNYAASLFSEMTGQTISDYVHGLRIKTAVYLLRHSGLTIADIAEQLGYCDASYFHRTFKKLTGTAPSEMLKERETPLL